MDLIIAERCKKYDHLNIPTGEYEVLSSYGVNIESGQTFIVPPEHPSKLGATFNREIGEWIL
jgi:hypothetical protein